MRPVEVYCVTCKQQRKMDFLDTHAGMDRCKCPMCGKISFKPVDKTHEAANETYLKKAKEENKYLPDNAKICDNCKHIIVPSKDFGSQFADYIPWWHYKRGKGFIASVVAEQNCMETGCGCKNPCP